MGVLVLLSKMVRAIFTLFVEIGRVVRVNAGDSGSLAVIVDVVDAKRVLVSDGTTRKMVAVSSLTLTKQKLSINRLQKNKKVAAAMKDADVEGIFAKSSLGQKLAKRQIRAGLSDFDRFKIMVAKQQKNKVVAAELKALK